MKIREIKETSLSKRKLLALSMAAIVTIMAGCNNVESVKETEITPSSSTSVEVPTSHSSSSEVELSSSSLVESSSEIEEIVEEVLPPEVEYSEWQLGDWTTDVYAESDTCRLVNQTTKTEQVWSDWSKGTTTPIEATATREVKEYEDHLYVKNASVTDQYGYFTGETTWQREMIFDEYGYFVDYAYTTYYSYRDLLGTNTYTLNQYETREVLNQEEIDEYNNNKKLELVKE